MYPRIKAEMSRTKITQEQLAQKLGVSRITFIHWMSGITKMPVCKLVQMCEIFQCSADYLLGREEKKR